MESIDEPLHAIFSNHVDTVYRAIDVLHPTIHRAVDMLCDTMLRERKVLVCGTGVAASLGQAFCTVLLYRSQFERPGLPALLLGADVAGWSGVTEGSGPGDVFSRQLLAIGQPGDALVIVAPAAGGNNLVQAVRAAHEKEIGVVALTGGGGGDVASLLLSTDIELRVPSDEPNRILETQYLVLNCLTALIESRLFGAAIQG